MIVWWTFAEHVYRISRFFNHQWAVAIPPTDATDGQELVYQLFGPRPPQSEGELEYLLGGFEEWTMGHSSPGPAGWGITCPSLRWERGAIKWHHETATCRYKITGVFADSYWDIHAWVQRPYPWQPVVAEMQVACISGEYTTHGRWYPPVAQRHVEAARELSYELGVVMPDVEFLTDDELIEADAEALRRWYQGKFVPYALES